MSARFYEHDIAASLKDKRALSRYLDQLVYQHLPQVKKVALTYIFCSDEYLLQINQQFLNHNTLTDIITFDLSESETVLQGEIYISVERTHENAAKFATTPVNELHRVIFHGALHLCGFKDKKEADQKKMRQMEDQCLQTYFKELKHAD